ncbi:DNA replication ATP-dependent helicase/nuclease DNA2 [Spatholobus suberectus]|nr:DNA replication ATP-dependent helicase/nuclease DNA2 [Spatholobus suberectus]
MTALCLASATTDVHCYDVITNKWSSAYKENLTQDNSYWRASNPKGCTCGNYCGNDGSYSEDLQFDRYPSSISMSVNLHRWGLFYGDVTLYQSRNGVNNGYIRVLVDRCVILAPRFDNGFIVSQDPVISYVLLEKSLNDNQRRAILKILMPKVYALI